MDAVTLIKKHVVVEDLLHHFKFDEVSRESKDIRACCKIHGGNNPSAFVISDEGLWFCHTGDCGGGDVFTLVQLMEEISFTESVEWLADFLGIDIESLEISERKEEYMKELNKFIQYMKNKVKSKRFPEYTPSAKLKDIEKFRAFKEETIQHFGMKYVEEIDLVNANGKPYKFFNRLMFPIIQNYIQVGISLRKIKSADFPKWSHQPEYIKTSELLYNLDAVRGARSIVVCEGICDVWAFHELGIVAVCTFGAHMTDHQYRILMRTGADIVLAYDGDDAGRKATNVATQLFRNKANVDVISFGDGEDPENVTREILQHRYDSRERKG